VLKEIDHPKIKIVFFLHTHVVLNLSSVKHQRRSFFENVGNLTV